MSCTGAWSSGSVRAPMVDITRCCDAWRATRRPVRGYANADSVRALLEALGRAASHPARVYLVGGATAVIEGWRATTVDVDMRIEPDDHVLRLLPEMKNRLDLNVELASPADFLPELPGWRDRSPFLFRAGVLDVFHYDLYSQALAKLERGFAQDVADVEAMIASGAVQPAQLLVLYEAIEDQLYRFPTVEPAELRAIVEALAT